MLIMLMLVQISKFKRYLNLVSLLFFGLLIVEGIPNHSVAKDKKPSGCRHDLYLSAQKVSKLELSCKIESYFAFPQVESNPSNVLVKIKSKYKTRIKIPKAKIWSKPNK